MSDKKKDIKDVFKNAVQERLTLHPNLWAGDDSAAVVRALAESQVDDKGASIKLTDIEKEAIQIACRPTFEVIVRLVKRMIETHGGTVDADTDDCIRRVVNATRFAAELTKAGFIKAQGASGLKDLLG